jgi:hypothetical protein
MRMSLQEEQHAKLFGDAAAELLRLHKLIGAAPYGPDAEAARRVIADFASRLKAAGLLKVLSTIGEKPVEPPTYSKQRELEDSAQYRDAAKEAAKEFEPDYPGIGRLPGERD